MSPMRTLPLRWGQERESCHDMAVPVDALVEHLGRLEGPAHARHVQRRPAVLDLRTHGSAHKEVCGKRVSKGR